MSNSSALERIFRKSKKVSLNTGKSRSGDTKENLNQSLDVFTNDQSDIPDMKLSVGNDDSNIKHWNFHQESANISNPGVVSGENRLLLSDPKIIKWRNKDAYVYTVDSRYDQGRKPDLEFVIYIPIDKTVEWLDADEWGKDRKGGKDNQYGQESMYGKGGQVNKYGKDGQDNRYGKDGQDNRYGKDGQDNRYGKDGQYSKYGKGGKGDEYGKDGWAGQDGGKYGKDAKVGGMGDDKGGIDGKGGRGDPYERDSDMWDNNKNIGQKKTSFYEYDDDGEEEPGKTKEDKSEDDNDNEKKKKPRKKVTKKKKVTDGDETESKRSRSTKRKPKKPRENWFDRESSSSFGPRELYLGTPKSRHSQHKIKPHEVDFHHKVLKN